MRCLRLTTADLQALRARHPDAAWTLLTTVARQLASNVSTANATIDRLEA